MESVYSVSGFSPGPLLGGPQNRKVDLEYCGLEIDNQNVYIVNVPTNPHKDYLDVSQTN